MKGLGHLGSVDPGAQTNFVVVGARVVARVVVGLGHLGSFGLDEQFGGHLGSVDPDVHENRVVVALVVVGA